LPQRFHVAVILLEHGVLKTDQVHRREPRQRDDPPQAASIEEAQRVARVDGHPSIVETRGVGSGGGGGRIGDDHDQRHRRHGSRRGTCRPAAASTTVSSAATRPDARRGGSGAVPRWGSPAAAGRRRRASVHGDRRADRPSHDDRTRRHDHGPR
jgi:hypothetical protein